MSNEDQFSIPLQPRRTDHPFHSPIHTGEHDQRPSELGSLRFDHVFTEQSECDEDVVLWFGVAEEDGIGVVFLRTCEGRFVRKREDGRVEREGPTDFQMVAAA
jgi:hypothetical protein